MSTISKMQTVLLIGATSGLGEAFARRLHALGKKVIITGRRADKLSALKKELPGLEIIQWDVSDLSGLPAHAKIILDSHPTLDTVWINAGIQKSFSFADPSTSTDKSIINEITTNVTAPMILTRLFVPHLVSLAGSGKPANLLHVSSGLAFIPVGLYPVYCPTKAAIHSFCVGLRQQINGASAAVKKNLSVVEIVPPYVDTGLDAEHREVVNASFDPSTAAPPMALDEYIDKAMEGLGQAEADGRSKKEIGVGLGQMGVDTWRGSFGQILEGMGFDC